MRRYFLFLIFVVITFLQTVFCHYQSVDEMVLNTDMLSGSVFSTSGKNQLDTFINSLDQETVSVDTFTVSVGFNNYIEYIYWSEPPILESLQFSPSSGPPNSSFIFRAKYTGLEPVKNGFPKVVIKKDDVDIDSSPFTMNYESGSSFTSGLIYSCTVQLISPATSYTYYYIAYDTNNYFLQTTQTKGPEVNNKPILCLTGDTGYETGAVQPSSGVVGTVFTFKIKYIDNDGHSPKPGYPKLYILKNLSLIRASTMSFVSGNFSSGAEYKVEVIFNEQEFGSLQYYFEVYDELGWKTETVVYSELKVSGGIPKIELVSLPTALMPSESFVFKIKYTDPDGDKPAEGYPKIKVKIGDKVVLSSSMSFVSGNYVDGALYQYESSFSTVSDYYSCFFEVMDLLGQGGLVVSTATTFIVSLPPDIPSNSTILEDKNANYTTSAKVKLTWTSANPNKDTTVVYQLFLGTNQQYMMMVYEGPDTNYVVSSLDSGKTYYWYVVAKDKAGRTTKSPIWTFNTINIDQNKTFNYPNPFNPIKEKTNIVFYSKNDGTAEIKICNEFGEVLYSNTVNVYKGSNSIPYDGKDDKGEFLKNGTYIAVINSNNEIKKTVIMVLKK